MAKKNYENYSGKEIGTGKVYMFFEWVWRLFVLNTLTLVTCLGVITIMPALIACFRTIKNCYEEDETHYIKRYYQNFVYCFKDTVMLGVFVLLIVGMLFYAYIYYSELIDALASSGGYAGWLNVYSVLLGFDIVFFMIIILVIVQFPMIATYFHFRFIDKIRFSFYMAYKHVGMSLMIFLIQLANTLLVLWLPYYFFVFFFTMPTMLTYMISRRVYWYTSNSMEYDENEEDEFDRQGKSVNKETYEDENEEDKIKAEKIKELEKMNNDIMNGEK